MVEVINPSKNITLPAYCHRYGWDTDPFSIQNDKSPFYVPPFWDQYLDVIQHVYQHENALITIMGPAGSGKSTFLKQLLFQIDSNILTNVVDAKSLLNAEALVNSMSNAFLSASPADDSVEEQLDHLLNAIQFNSQHCLLIIDNAQQLSIDIVQYLFYCVEQQTEYHMRLHIILCGDPTLKQLLDTATFSRSKQIKIHPIHLQQFKAQDIKYYLQHRINNMGEHHQNPFNNDFITHIQSETNGNPRNINLKAQQLLQNGMIPPIKKINKVNNKPSFSYQNGLITLCLVIAIIIAATFHLPAKKTNVVSGTLYKAPTLVPQKKQIPIKQLNPIKTIKVVLQPNALYPNNNDTNNHEVRLNASQINSINNLNLLMKPTATNKTKPALKKSSKIKNKNKPLPQVIHANLT